MIRYAKTPAALLLASLPLMAAAQQPLDHDAYEIWQSIGARDISDDGQWVHYATSPEKGDGALHVVGTSGSSTYRIARGKAAAFSSGSEHLVFLIAPPEDSVRAAKLAKKKGDEMPKDSLGILDLRTGSIHKRARVQSFKLPEDAGAFLAFREEMPADGPDSTEADSEDSGGEDGAPLVVLNLESGQEQRFESADDFLFSKNGGYLAYSASGDSGAADAMILVRTDSMEPDTLAAGKGTYTHAAFDDAGMQLAFLTDRDDQDADDPALSLYLWRDGSTEALVTPDQLTEGQSIGKEGRLSFSDSGNRLFFGTAEKPAPEEDEEKLEEEKVVLDIWNWKDPLLQPMQLENLEDDQERTYRAVVHLASGEVVQLATPALPSVAVSQDGDGDFAVSNTNMPYRQEVSWDWPRYVDVHAIDVKSGASQLLLERVQSSASLSPDGMYLTWWDRDELAWMLLPTAGGTPVNLSSGIPHALHNELHDWPYKPSAYGALGWTEDDASFLVYDKFDIWALDPNGVEEPVSVTEGFGRSNDLRLRYVRLDQEEDALDPEAMMLLSAFNTKSKASGFYRDRVRGTQQPEQLVMMDLRFSTPRKAKDADRLLFTRESFKEFDDLWTSGLDFADQRRLSDANPQQAEYTWGTAELVRWTSLDGLPLTGILYKPDGFDPGRQYPMLVYFYEKMSDGLHQYRPPTTARSSISFSFYVSRGYLVFVPDIPYKVGYPGESALNAVVPGVTSLVNRGFVQEESIGVQGHSWGGYQIAYMITETDLFEAAEAGAPVSNMTSAYGGIRWASGMSRMFQYEKSQSRIGGSLWEYPLRYIDNSPLFQADKINTPVLMLHNDDDGAVPWYQGIEFFVALRRLGKPVWLLNYNGEGHGLGKYQNRRDFAIRMQQFFDHYLKGAPSPVWMEEGVPATEKGRTLGLDPASGK